MNIVEHIANIKKAISPAQLIVVSKYRTVSEIMAVYNAGQRLFAENRVQALLERQTQLPADIEWHLIGHLQTNKAKNIAPFIHTVHSVDSAKLLEILNNEAAKNNRNINVLLQVKVAVEGTKFGLNPSDLRQLCKLNLVKTYPNLRFTGLMAMASLTANQQQISAEFDLVNHIFQEIKPMFNEHFKELSMGMSSDYKIAIKHGSTYVRIGTAVFEPQ